MNISAQNRHLEISRLKLPTKAKEMLLGKLCAGEFKEYFEQPEYFYSQGWPDNPGYWKDFEEDVLLPLWEYSECIYVAKLSSDPVQFLSFRIESPDEPTLYGTSIYQMIFELIDFHCFQIGAPIEEACEFMHSIEFPYIEEFRKLALLDEPEFDSEYDKYFEKMSSM